MAQKRSLDESSEIPLKMTKFDEDSSGIYLQPIDFIRSSTSPCINQIATALFNVEEKRVRSNVSFSS